jgi:hypothetical protein
LKDGVITLMRGQVDPPGALSANLELSSVHGQPLLPGGGGGKSLSFGQIILF